MSQLARGRNDPCFCGSGKKYKKCCYPRVLPSLGRPNGGISSPDKQQAAFRRATARLESLPDQEGDGSIARADPGRTRVKCAAMPPYGDGEALAGTLAPPTPEQVEAKYETIRSSNPEGVTEVLVTYTYPEMFGFAHVRMVFDADENVQLPNGRALSVLNLFRGMQVQLADGSIGTIVGNPERRYDIPVPPLPRDDGLWSSRVIGHVKHTAHEVFEVRVAGQVIRGTPGHLMWSVSRCGWVRAYELAPGEMVRLSDNSVVPVQQVGPRRAGLIEVFGIEVEYFHNYFIGNGERSMLVHNGPECLVRIKDADGKPIPYGFKSMEQYQAFTQRLKSGLPEGSEALFQGSSVTGKSYKTGEPFDVGRKSDFDIAVVHDESFLGGLELGARAKGGGTRIGPLNEAQTQALGLENVQQDLASMAGRPVKFMLFDTMSSALQRPSIWVQ